jgi:hypothetical protein
MRVKLYLRVVALLTVVGKLSEQHRQGVVALLGGVLFSTSGDTSDSTSGVASSMGDTNTSAPLAASSSATTDSADANTSSRSSSHLSLPEPPSLAAVESRMA